MELGNRKIQIDGMRRGIDCALYTFMALVRSDVKAFQCSQHAQDEIEMR